MPSSLVSASPLPISNQSAAHAWVRERIGAHIDPAYQAFQAKLIPTLDPKKIEGVRMPDLRRIAKQLMKDTVLSTAYLHELPHTTYEENNIHGLVINEFDDFEECIAALDAFLPEVDNWATCDLLSPHAFEIYARAPHEPDALLAQVDRWIASTRTYTIRFGVGVLMGNYLGTRFTPAIQKRVADIRSPEYYVNMMRAWFFAEALAKQEKAALDVLEQRRLDTWTHNKAIQKAIESRRIAPDLKERLRCLKVKQPHTSS